MTARDRRLLLGLALVSSLFLMGEATGALGPLLLYLAPLVAVALPLLAGRYVGEERIVQLARSPRQRRPHHAPRLAAPAAVRRAAGALPRGGRLIASSLAVRPPPVPVLSS